MPKTTIRPTSQSPIYKRIAATGGSAAAVVADQSDATYIRRSAAKAPLARFVLAAPTIPAGSDVATIVPGARLKQPTSVAPKLVTLAMSVPGEGAAVNKIKPTVNGPVVRAGSGTAAYTYATEASAGSMEGPTGPWADVLDVLAIRVNDGHAASDSNRATIYELFADVYYAARPTGAVAISPTSPVTTTSYPELTATFSALIESWQDNAGSAARTEIAYELKVFTAAQYGAAGFDPETSECLWSTQGLTAPLDYVDGVTLSSEAAAVTPDVPLPNGTYKAYARGRRYFTAAEYGDWATLTFGINVTPPSAPTLAVTRDDADQRIAIVAAAPTASGATSPTLTIERSEDGGLTWETVRGADREAIAFATATTIYDYEAARGTALRYRANVQASFDGLYLVSDWSTLTVTGTLSATGWNIKAPEDPTLNMLGVLVKADPEHTQSEDISTFRPVGRRYPVVVSMSLGGADASLEITTSTASEWAALEAIREYQGTLYLESPWGWARYIRIQSRSWVESGSGSSTRRTLAASYVEVEAP